MRKYIIVLKVRNYPDLTAYGAVRIAEERVRGRLKTIPAVKNVTDYVDEDGMHLPCFLEIISESDIFDALKGIGEIFFEVMNPAKA